MHFCIPYIHSRTFFNFNHCNAKDPVADVSLLIVSDPPRDKHVPIISRISWNADVSILTHTQRYICGIWSQDYIIHTDVR